MAPPPVDLDDFDMILSCDEASLPASSLPVPSNGNGNGGTPARVNAVEEDWTDDPIPTKLDKIRAAFLNSKTAAEVQTAAWLMPIGDWLEMVVKLSPKNVQITGGISFRHMMEEFGPIEKDKYRFNAIPVECTELAD